MKTEPRRFGGDTRRLTLGGGSNQYRWAAAALALSSVLPWGAPGVSSSSAWAADVPVGSSGKATSLLPPIFNASLTQGMSNLYSNCDSAMPAITQALEALKNRKGKVVTGADGKCDGPEEVPEAPTCDTLKDPDGLYSPAALKRESKALDDVLATWSCKKNALAKAQKDLQCMTSQSQLLAEQIGRLQQEYTTNLARQKQDVTKINSVISDRQDQFQQVGKRLNGDEKGRTGISQQASATEAVLAGMALEIDGPPPPPDAPNAPVGIRERLKQQENDRKKLTEVTELRKTALMNSCFATKTRANFICDDGIGTPVTASRYASCRIFEEMQKSSRGVVRQDMAMRTQATRRQQAFEQLLKRISEDSVSADLAAISGNAEADAALIKQREGKSTRVYTPDDIEMYYGDELGGFNVGSLDIKKFVMSVYRGCYKEADGRVKDEQKNANSTLGQIAERMKVFDRMLSKDINQLLDKYARVAEDGAKVLTGRYQPVDVSNCKTLKPSAAAACLEDFRKLLNGMLKGTGPDTQLSLVFPGAVNAETTFGVECNGLLHCKEVLLATADNLEREDKKLNQFKESYVQQSNAATDRYTDQIAQSLSSQNKLLRDKLDKLNVMLSNLGVEAVSIEDIEAEALEADPDPKMGGLYGPPRNVLNLIGGKMKPPMLDVNPRSFAGALGGIRDAVTSANQKVSEITKQKSVYQNLGVKCAKETIKEELDKVNRDIETLKGPECTAQRDYCESIRSTLGATIASINQIASGFAPGESLTDLSSALGGFGDACIAQEKQLRKELVELQAKQKRGRDCAKSQALWKDYSTKAIPLEQECDSKVEELQGFVDALPADATSATVSDAKRAVTAQKSTCTTLKNQNTRNYPVRTIPTCTDDDDLDRVEEEIKDINASLTRTVGGQVVLPQRCKAVLDRAEASKTKIKGILDGYEASSAK